MSEARRRVTVVNERGLHARASHLFVATALDYDAQVTVKCEDLVVRADSILSLLECAAGPGTEIEIIAEGPDAEPAVAALAALVEAGFNE